jgi:competence protein ComEA
MAIAFFAVSIDARNEAILNQSYGYVVAHRLQELPDGPGKEETRKVCSGCHELGKSCSLRQDRAAWQTTIEKMMALGAKASDQELAAVLDYLSKHFPADDIPLIRINKATSIELESGLSLKRSEAAALIRYRESIGGFKSLEDLKRVPGVPFARIEAKKDRITFED